MVPFSYFPAIKPWPIRYRLQILQRKHYPDSRRSLGLEKLSRKLYTVPSSTEP